MKKNTNFLLFLIILTGIGVFFVMKPFLLSIFLAFILATLFSKTNKRLTRKLKGHKAWSSFLMCLWVITILIILFFIITALMISEADSLIQEMQYKNISINLDVVKSWPI
ncbi:MAG: AI-2E family transporter, partial [Candidatus Moranbacteria bacterium]|nr:AI-2E family transporter [Candidatus Moranbacteria bacterium]